MAAKTGSTYISKSMADIVKIPVENLLYWSVVGAQSCEDTKLIFHVINFELVQPIHPRYIDITDGQTDGRTT